MSLYLALNYILFSRALEYLWTLVPVHDDGKGLFYLLLKLLFLIFLLINCGRFSQMSCQNYQNATQCENTKKFLVAHVLQDVAVCIKYVSILLCMFVVRLLVLLGRIHYGEQQGKVLQETQLSLGLYLHLRLRQNVFKFQASLGYIVSLSLK